MRESGGERVRCFAVLLYRVEARGQERPRCLSPRSRETFEMTTELVILIAEKNKRTWTSVREDVKDDRFRAREVLETGGGEAGVAERQVEEPELFSGGLSRLRPSRSQVAPATKVPQTQNEREKEEVLL